LAICGTCPTRGGHGNRVERVRVLAAGEHQAFVGGRFPARLTPEHRLERHAAADQPVEVLDASLAVVGDALLVGARPHRRVQERRHIVDGIVEAAGTLESGAAPEVDESARHRGRPAPAAGAFQDDHVGTRCGGLDRGGRARNAVSGDDYVGFVVPVRDLLSRRRVHGCVDLHGCIATGSSPVHWWPQ
jgi:hypothetical protein